MSERKIPPVDIVFEAEELCVNIDDLASETGSDVGLFDSDLDLHRLRAHGLKCYLQALADVDAKILERATDWKIWQQDEIRGLRDIAMKAEEMTAYPEAPLDDDEVLGETEGAETIPDSLRIAMHCGGPFSTHKTTCHEMIEVPVEAFEEGTDFVFDGIRKMGWSVSSIVPQEKGSMTLGLLCGSCTKVILPDEAARLQRTVPKEPPS